MPAALTAPQAMQALTLVLLVAGLLVVAAWVWLIVRLALERRLLPPASPRSVPWGIGSIVTVIAFYFALQFGVASTYYALTQPPPGQAPAAKEKPKEKPKEVAAPKKAASR